MTLGRALSVAVAAAVVGAGGVAAVWWFRPPEELARFAAGPPPELWAARERQERVWAATGSGRKVRYTYRPLERISRELAVAVVAGEDLGYFSHRGIDPTAIREAVAQWLAGKRLRGASTITQQLARTLFLSNDRTVTRKLSEARLAFWLDRRLGKRRVLELYLNLVEFGPGIYGAEAAARHYYGRGADELDTDTAAGLAAAIPSPAADNPATRSRRWQWRTRTIAGRMARATWLWERLAALGVGRLVKHGEAD